MARKKRVKIFLDLKQSLEEALAYERQRPVNLRATRLPPSPARLAPSDIRAIRRSLHASQALFARYLNVSTNTVESWEQGTRRPRSAALKLLALARRSPVILLHA